MSLKDQAIRRLFASVCLVTKPQLTLACHKQESILYVPGLGPRVRKQEQRHPVLAVDATQCHLWSVLPSPLNPLGNPGSLVAAALCLVLYGLLYSPEDLGMALQALAPTPQLHLPVPLRNTSQPVTQRPGPALLIVTTRTCPSLSVQLLCTRPGPSPNGLSRGKLRPRCVTSGQERAGFATPSTYPRKTLARAARPGPHSVRLRYVPEEVTLDLSPNPSGSNCLDSSWTPDPGAASAAGRL